MYMSGVPNVEYHPGGMPTTGGFHSILICMKEYISPVFKGGFNFMIETTENKLVKKINIIDEHNLGFMMTMFSEKYKLRKANEIGDFLSGNDYLIPLVSDAYGHLQKYFPGSPIFIEVERGDLVISVGTKLSPEQAIKKLDEFDEDWWLDACIDSRAKLCITVEYQ